MGWTMRVSLPGYDCLTDGTIDHYALYADSDNILIKEKERGTISIGSGATGTINHNLGYIPFTAAYIYNGTKYLYLYGQSSINNYRFRSNGTSTYVVNFDGTARTARYYIFHDELP